MRFRLSEARVGVKRLARTREYIHVFCMTFDANFYELTPIRVIDKTNILKN